MIFANSSLKRWGSTGSAGRPLAAAPVRLRGRASRGASGCRSRRLMRAELWGFARLEARRRLRKRDAVRSRTGTIFSRLKGGILRRDSLPDEPCGVCSANGASVQMETPNNEKLRLMCLLESFDYSVLSIY
ncbi:hypothetical protein R5R35_005523 [Gryllus longicercus]|uniref:Uncharacterized protein n=1 Tax=Gryllus longicercus TaxID=2509291 RepID=A0AAN9VIX8_9ORTH